MLIKIDRIFAWILFAGVLLYFVSGFGMTKGIIDSSLAAKLHTGWLTWIIVLAFVMHSSLAIRLAFMRWKILNLLTTILLVAFYLVVVAGFIYVERFYQKQSTRSVPNEEMSLTTKTTTADNPTTTVKTFDATELSRYNGQNGQSAYVAVEGKVYDMTQVFVNGNHFSHIAGTELTSEFFSRHDLPSITKYPVVGIFK